MSMNDMQWLLEILLTGLLTVTLFHALRLERALGVLRRDRAALEELIVGFNESTRQAESGIDRLRAVADGAGRQIARHVDQAKALKSDLVFLSERGEKLADQLDILVRKALPAPEILPIVSPGSTRAASALHAVPQETGSTDVDGRIRSQAEKELLRALRLAR